MPHKSQILFVGWFYSTMGKAMHYRTEKIRKCSNVGRQGSYYGRIEIQTCNEERQKKAL